MRDPLTLPMWELWRYAAVKTNRIKIEVNNDQSNIVGESSGHASRSSAIESNFDSSDRGCRSPVAGNFEK